MPRFDLRGRAPAQAARVKEPVLPRQSRILPRNDGRPKNWPSGVPMVEGGAMGASDFNRARRSKKRARIGVSGYRSQEDDFGFVLIFSKSIGCGNGR